MSNIIVTLYVVLSKGEIWQRAIVKKSTLKINSHCGVKLRVVVRYVKGLFGKKGNFTIPEIFLTLPISAHIAKMVQGLMNRLKLQARRTISAILCCSAKIVIK